MRFDDRITTITTQGSNDPGARSAVWRQLVDVIAQSRPHEISDDTRQRCYAFLRANRDLIDPTRRADVVRGLVGRRLPDHLVQFFAEDHPAVSAPMLTTVKMDASAWQGLIPRLSPIARSIVRQRKDLDPAVARQLGDYGASDLMLDDGRAIVAPALPETDMQSAPESADVAAPAGSTSEMAADATPKAGQIRELVERIERFRETRRSTAAGIVWPAPPDSALMAPPVAAVPTVDQLRHFRFETDHEGAITWVDAPDRTALIGHVLGEAAEAMGYGVDGHVAGAFARRSAFRDGRLLVAGQGRAAGQWCLSAVPLFEDATGRFRGYRGTARRPYPHELQPDRAISVAGAGHLPAGAVVDQAAEMQRLRELVHELRTPLNAITGFGDMIRHQFLGPVAQAYRDQAGAIVDAAGEITQIIDDLALFVRGNDAVHGSAQPVPNAAVDQGVDGVAVLHRVLTAHRDQAEALNLHLQVQTGRAVPPLAMGEQVLERMMSRLLGNVLALCGQGEAVSVDYLNLPSADGCACLSVSRPGQLLGIPAEALFDPDRGTEELAIDGPRLSLGFTLHLLRNLARQYHGDLDVAEHDIVLVLPMVQREDLIRTP